MDVIYWSINKCRTGTSTPFPSWKINWTAIVHRLKLRRHGIDHINVEVLRKYIISIPERCTAVITATDGHTKYYS